MPRRFIRHPAAIPIQLIPNTYHEETVVTADVSAGGLSVISDHMIEPGAGVNVKIFIAEPPFSICGYVVWCRKEKDGFHVGISFADLPTAHTLRMVEQVCHIEQYRQDAFAQGRYLSEEEAALEWISKYAANFYPHTGIKN
ncbi:PilZ domain-containing protein [Neptuniibacter sp. CAU 1671]|uniref:PilZ domain-containing protein n=1 Tax=Neptuniibacter sp. CAU 1671 TaxID=3032593 RepID=UPI0023D97F77|nr:PilZ domain-containing protein [Neptuniibacter sp. CAU 1671]MDF2182262.1 PilZ domain-containing protein [Neptuniibacter sp. CAU 1671]